MVAVFVSYRVRDEPGYATLVHRELARRFGFGQVFLAARSIGLGDNFADRIHQTLTQCQVLLAVIGPRWVPDLGDPETDWVQVEIREALTRRMRVIPILVEDTAMPRELDLPTGIKPLARCQHLRLRHYSVDNDLARLLQQLTNVLPVLADNAPAFGTPAWFRFADRPRSTAGLSILAGSILRATTADIWVNSENTEMRMARPTDLSISGIIRYWGARRDETGHITADIVADALEEHVGERRPVAPTTAIATESGELRRTHNVAYIVHVAAVHGEPGAGYRQVGDIGGCVRNALGVAETLIGTLRRRTILFPLLGTGVAGADITGTVQMIVSAATEYLTDHTDSRLRWIQFLGYSQREHQALVDAFRSLPLMPGEANGPP
ncbi:TIR domain-containing protein [Nocardia terpenica]|uniref:TIR domain-containing protein n=1 Tax=Nocardia terpenica TaxID=455432 RepID=UPI001895A753|nr:TIR domain-containing protein [Nocardia terpenica]MBF6066125.1 TIR domain-containing protein [Nocardia terpenica]MBF6109184.1 TIR domain-containing protein [Nocardia terpenica]MBF6116369.1 TIR domain-containing protein [Nocardia terpenica]MBF6123526.1 TIR domain-containing protein [Nocardia terpenica]MBF6156803.1 TIR domain-containing protein [Nocardia terpenica]